MMKIKIFILFNFIIFNSISASILTVDNKHPYVAQYQYLSAAHDAANAGDTIYVYPSIQPYNGITVTKRLTFMGVGFDLNETPGEPYTPSTLLGTMHFNTGSEGSMLVGFDGSFGISINTGNIIIKKNRLLFIYLTNGSGSVIIQNKIVGRGSNIGYSSYFSIYSSSTTNIIIANNIIVNPNSSQSYDNSLGGINSSIIMNNVIKAPAYAISGSSNEIVNNIIILGGLASNNLYTYNMFYSSNSILENGVGNIQNIDMNSVFVDYVNYNFKLLINSPAIAAGEYGADMGIYGGDAPYVDGGFPGLPSILQILAPTVGSQQSGLNIQFKAKSNNE